MRGLSLTEAETRARLLGGEGFENDTRVRRGTREGVMGKYVQSKADIDGCGIDDGMRRESDGNTTQSIPLSCRCGIADSGARPWKRDI